MFKLEKCQDFVAAIKFLSDNTSEAKINYCDEQILIEASNLGQIVFMNVIIPKTCFLEWEDIPKTEYEEDGEWYEMDTNHFINVNDTYKAMKDYKNEMSFTRKGNKIYFIADGDKFDTDVTVPDWLAEIPDLSTLEFETSFEFRVDLIKDIINKLKIYDDNMLFEAKEKKLIIVGRGNGNSKTLTRPINRIGKYSKCIYGYSLFKTIGVSDKLTETVIVSMGNGYPIQIVYTLKSGIQIKVAMAPRVDDEDE